MSDTVNRLMITAHGVGEVRLRGEVDAHSAPELLTWMSTQMLDSSRIVVDLSGVSFVDSSGLRALLELDRRLTASERTLVLRAPNEKFLRLLDIAGLTGHFTNGE